MSASDGRTEWRRVRTQLVLHMRVKSEMLY